jgi:hypothetical protein
MAWSLVGLMLAHNTQDCYPRLIGRRGSTLSIRGDSADFLAMTTSSGVLELGDESNSRSMLVQSFGILCLVTLRREYIFSACADLEWRPR